MPHAPAVGLVVAQPQSVMPISDGLVRVEGKLFVFWVDVGDHPRRFELQHQVGAFRWLGKFGIDG